MTAADVSSWPFWAPSDLESVERALDLAGVVAGETVADLGCGDGQVLVAAAKRGARVVGVESDAELVDLAREALDVNGLDGEVFEGDLFDVDLVADVYFTYLAPATLQRLVPSLGLRRGARLVTVDFEVPGLAPHGVAGSAHLYRIPVRRRRRPARPGWSCAGALVIAPPGHQSLTVLDVHHPGGAVEARLLGDIGGAAALLTGADHVRERDAVAVDLRWDDRPTGTLLRGQIEIAGLEPFEIVASFDDDAEEGCWELSAEGMANVSRHLDDVVGTGGTTGSALIAAAEG